MERLRNTYEIALCPPFFSHFHRVFCHFKRSKGNVVPRLQTLEALSLAAVMALIIALPARAQTLPDDFDQLDVNADAIVEFSEFAAFAERQGQTRTQAAQSFIALTHGDAVITKADFLFAAQVQTSPTWERGYSLPLLEGDIEEVETVTLQGRIIDNTPNEEVAGEVIRTFEDGRLDDDILGDDEV